MAGSGPFVFISMCPKCKDVRSQVTGGYRLLIQQLDGNRPVQAHCKICGESWTISELERSRLEKDLTIFRFF